MNKENKARLKVLETAYLTKKYPSVPTYALAYTSFKDNSANELTKSIVKFLIMSGWQAERINTMGVYREAKKVQDMDGITRVVGKGKYTPSGSTKGSADISATIYGRSVKIEVKYGRDVQSEAQKKYQQAIEAAGGIYIIAREFDSFIEWYDSFLSELKK
jgi:hypothetical protein